MVIEHVGLRERKREETRRQLEQAAVEIASEQGLDHTTVDAISARANVSPRTFFNYFESKEDAILGVRDADITPQTLEEHAERYAGADTARSIIGLLSTVFAPTLSDSATQHARIELVRRYPNLMARRAAQFTRMSNQLIAAVGQSLDTPTHTSLAEVLLSLCGGAFRVAVTEWMKAGGTGTHEDIEARAVSLIREAQGKLL